MLLLVVVLGLVFSLNDVLYYFNGYRQENRFGDRNTELAYAVATYVNDLDEGQFVYFYGPPHVYTSFPTFPFLLRDVTPGIDFVDVAEGEVVLNAAAPRIVFIYLPERFTEHSQVVSQFPGGDLQTFSGTFADPLFYAYAVDSE